MTEQQEKLEAFLRAARAEVPEEIRLRCQAVASCEDEVYAALDLYILHGEEGLEALEEMRAS